MYLATISPECMSEKNCDGKTPLDVAILFENQDAVAFLLGITNKMRLYTPKESDNDDEGLFGEIPEFEEIVDSDWNTKFEEFVIILEITNMITCYITFSDQTFAHWL